MSLKIEYNKNCREQISKVLAILKNNDIIGVWCADFRRKI